CARGKDYGYDDWSFDVW
nr:immunoglobulin heavy chain junction region [Mus musculus]